MNPKPTKKVLVSCRLEQELADSFRSALRGQGVAASTALRHLIMAYVKHAKIMNGSPIIALEFKMPGNFDEVNRQPYPTRAHSLAGYGVGTSKTKELAKR